MDHRDASFEAAGLLEDAAMDWSTEEPLRKLTRVDGEWNDEWIKHAKAFVRNSRKDKDIVWPISCSTT